MADLILCRSDAGDGGWSLHPPGTTDEAIANGDARILASGEAEMAPGTRVDADDDSGIIMDPDFADAPASAAGMAWVAWDSGVRTWTPIDVIRPAGAVVWTRPNAADYRDAWLMAGPNSASSIALQVESGARFTDEADRERARSAAAATLNCYGLPAADVAAAYRAQWGEYDDEDRMHGAALIWIEARQAADLALTEGWASPDGASCSIEA